MSALPSFLSRLVKDPPPELVFEIASDSIRMASTSNPDAIAVEPLPAGVVSPSPLHDNVSILEPFSEAVSRLMPGNNRSKRRTAALLLPDYCAHITVLDFANLPEKTEEQLALIRFRLKRTVPFDMESAALGFWVQDGGSRKAKGHREAVVAVASREIVSRYEAPFLAAGVHPGQVSLAPLACLDLVEPVGIKAVARLSGRVLTVLVQQDANLRVARSIVLDEVSTTEIASHLHPTFVYIEDNVGAAATELFLAGFGSLEEAALREFPSEFQLPVRLLGGPDTAIRGYLKAVAA